MAKTNAVFQVVLFSVAVLLFGSAVFAASTSYNFNALIGSVLNNATAYGPSLFTKFLAASPPDAFQQGFTTATNVPPVSPYSAAGYVPISTPAVAWTNGGGMSFSSFTNGAYDNLFRINSAQLPGLASNLGANGENEYLWLTGFPVYDQWVWTSPHVQNLAVLDAGGAYQIMFSNPIHEPNRSCSTPICPVNAAPVQMLGQNWSIVTYFLPNGVATSNTLAVRGGGLGLTHPLVPLTTVYVGKNLTTGQFTAQLANLGTASNAGVTPAVVNIYYKGVETNTTIIWPVNTVEYNIAGNIYFVRVNQTFAGLYAYQKWAKIQVYSGLFNISDGLTFNRTSDPGWNVNLLWVNESGNGHYTDLQSIILYNTTPTTLTPGQSLTFIQNPSPWKLTFIGDTLGNNYDAITAQLEYANAVTYANPANATGNGLGNINNITEPAQELVLTSQIPNAFSYAGQTSSSITYLLSPLKLVEFSHSTPNGTPVYLLLESSGISPANYITASNPLGVTVTGYPTNTASSPVSTTLTFSSLGEQGTSVNFYNITSIRINRALPGVGILAYNTSSAVGYNNLLAGLWPPLGDTGPEILYGPQPGTTYYSVSSNTMITYNQQNGQPTSTFNFGNYQLPAPRSWFTYYLSEYNVPGNTLSQDTFWINVVGPSTANPTQAFFQLNDSVLCGSSTSSSCALSPNNVTYESSQFNSVAAGAGFISERGSKVALVSPLQLTFDLAKSIDTLQFVVVPQTTTTTTSTTTTTITTTVPPSPITTYPPTNPAFYVSGYNAVAQNAQYSPGNTLRLDGNYGYLETHDGWIAQYEQAQWVWDFGQQYTGNFAATWYTVDSVGTKGCSTYGTNVTVTWAGSLNGVTWTTLATNRITSFGSYGSPSLPLSLTAVGATYRYISLTQRSDIAHMACPVDTYVDAVSVTHK
jgi:hypothetical protein